MNPRELADAGGPGPEQLAAYVDGELDPEARAEVETWLAGHPEAAAEVDALRNLARLWQSAPPPEPAEEQWANVLARIEAALAAAARPARRRRLVWGLAAFTAAASVVLAVVWYRPAEVVPPGSAGPLPMVAADDVEIISLEPADARALVIGEPPVPGLLALLGPGEATVDQVRNDMEGMDPYYPSDGSTASPMVIMMPRDEDS